MQQDAQDRAGADGAGADVAATALPARPLRPIPRRSIRPWAGHRLGDEGEHVGELWLAGPDSIVEAGELGAVTLDTLAAATGEALVGRLGMALLGARFPLLVKLIDAAEWLSLQVHPGDELAAELFGPGALGKTEAWLVLDGGPDAVLVTGPRHDLADAELRAAIAEGRLDRDGCELRPCVPGDALLVPAGTIHAIGAGAFVYEIEQPSDITFRISDWGRTATPDRPLHLGEALRAVEPANHAIPVGDMWQLVGGALSVRELRLELVALDTPSDRRPGGDSLEVITAIEGTAVVSGDGWLDRLDPYDTLVIPACVPEYRIASPAGGRVCVGSIPEL